MTDWVVPGLRKKRAEVAGKIAAYERDIGQLRADLRNIDAVLRLFGFDNPELIPDKRAVKPKTLWFHGGECALFALDALRNRLWQPKISIQPMPEPGNWYRRPSLAPWVE